MVYLQTDFNQPGFDRILESPRLKKFKRTRQQFRFFMSSLTDSPDIDIDTIWQDIVDHFGIPVKEWGKFPSDEHIDPHLSSDQLEIYTCVYHQANIFLQTQVFRLKGLDHPEDIAEFWGDFMTDLNTAEPKGLPSLNL